ncbi:hypothetical protein [Nocardia bovistercoris]|uniref:Uncharacterized protein n=1 Tax=Nocardia bovistercoris TaxID=2785916 RepID=A0A931I8E3_9NOCA|nr:hypothetical protein [Nocardia bovistercoris]MBH0776201.1 hypothetical protein [Nocardia bovistercoris]
MARITIVESARKHGISDDEIRAVVSYPMLRTRLTQRLPETLPYPFIGNFDQDEPPIEVIADLVDPAEWVVFHAMMLRPQMIRQLQLEELFEFGDLAYQRPGKESWS